MVFSSIPFLFFFLPVFFLLYYIVPFRAKNGVLLLFSLIFYAWGEPIYILLMVLSSVIDYTIGRLMDHYDKTPWKRTVLLCASIFANLSILGFFKYADFFLETVNRICHTSIPLLKLPLPIGISFFTFQTMSYSIDLYCRKIKVEKNFFTFMTYVSMFPQLIAGPIVRFSTVNEELHGRRIHWKGFYEGGFRFLQGLLKKVLLANQMGALWKVIQEQPYGEISVLTAWFGAITFTLQLYFDFSAYSDMAIGMGRMMGFHFLENFEYPLCAKSVTEFWRRWHISLSSWFRDYVYIPLGGNRKGVEKQIRNIAIVWFLTGMWHGASWNYIVWGVYYGILLIMEKFVWGQALKKLPRFIQHVYAFFIVVVGFTIFVFEDWGALGRYLMQMLGVAGNGLIGTEFLYYFRNYGLLFLFCMALAMPLYPWILKKIKEWKKKGWFHEMIFGSVIKGVTVVFYLTFFMIAVAYLVSDTYNPFLYFRF